SLRALVGDQRGAGSVGGQLVALAALVGFDGQKGAGEPGPGLHVTGVEHDGLRVGAGRGSRIVAGGQHLVAFRLELPGAALGLPVGLEIRLVALGVARDAGMGEALLLSLGPGPSKARGKQRDEKGEDETESEVHGALVPSTAGNSPAAGLSPDESTMDQGPVTEQWRRPPTSPPLRRVAPISSLLPLGHMRPSFDRLRTK